MRIFDAVKRRLGQWIRPRPPLRLPAAMLIGLALLSSGCGTSLRSLAPGVRPASVPPLPQAARQPTRTESFSATVLRDIESWEKRQIAIESQETPASAPTKR